MEPLHDPAADAGCRQHPLPALLRRTERWLTQPEIARLADADFPEEDYVARTLKLHVSRGELAMEPRDPESDVYVYGLPGWPRPAKALSPEAQAELERIQRITRGSWQLEVA